MADHQVLFYILMTVAPNVHNKLLFAVKPLHPWEHISVKYSFYTQCKTVGQGPKHYIRIDMANSEC